MVAPGSDDASYLLEKKITRKLMRKIMRIRKCGRLEIKWEMDPTMYAKHFADTGSVFITTKYDDVHREHTVIYTHAYRNLGKIIRSEKIEFITASDHTSYIIRSSDHFADLVGEMPLIPREAHRPVPLTARGVQPNAKMIPIERNAMKLHLRKREAKLAKTKVSKERTIEIKKLTEVTEIMSSMLVKPDLKKADADHIYQTFLRDEEQLVTLKKAKKAKKLKIESEIPIRMTYNAVTEESSIAFDYDVKVGTIVYV